jgi:hypothetical protein
MNGLVMLLTIVTTAAPGHPISVPARHRPDSLTAEEVLALRTAAAVVRLGSLPASSGIWPGYDAASRPLLLYVPDRWAVLLNAPAIPEGFTAYPADWPRLGASAALHRGPLGDLAGQLAFDYDVAGVRVAAIPFLPTMLNAPVQAFAFVVHEAFHQYQRERFGEVESGSEERYPMLDSVNTALTVVEMRLLEDAVDAAARGDRAAVLRLARAFAAIRAERWRRGGTLVAFEREKELTEGTAKYVEVRSVGAMSELCARDRARGGADAFCSAFEGVTSTSYLLEDFAGRLPGGVLAPEDMPRNRIYPEGAALGMLLDFLGVEWKPAAERESAAFEYAKLLEGPLGGPPDRFTALADSAREHYGFARIEAAAATLVAQYRRDFEAALATFEAQPGVAVSVVVPVSGLSRSRSSSARRFTMEDGRRVLGRYIVYALRQVRGPALSLRVREGAVLESDDPATGARTVRFFAPAPDSLELNGRPLAERCDGEYAFQRARLSGGSFELTCAQPGVLAIRGREIRVELVRP